MVDDSHATGFIGARGRGYSRVPRRHGQIDIMTGTLGKALGGASGGYVSARKEIVGWLRQRSRPYLFSNSIAPPVAAGTLKVLDLLESTPELRRAVARQRAAFSAGNAASRLRSVAGRASRSSPSCSGEAPVAGAARRAHAGSKASMWSRSPSGRAARQGADPHAIERRALDLRSSTT